MRRFGQPPAWSTSDVQARIAAITAHAGRRMRFTPETTAMVITALEFYCREGLADRALNFTVDTWTPDGSRLVEHIALTSKLAIAHVVYAEVVRERPDDFVTLRHMTRLIRQSR